jgi:hypothetical protein
LVIKTAKMLGLTVPPGAIAIVDEAIKYSVLMSACGTERRSRRRTKVERKRSETDIGRLSPRWEF